MSPIFNSSSKSTGFFFFLQTRKYTTPCAFPKRKTGCALLGIDKESKKLSPVGKKAATFYEQSCVPRCSQMFFMTFFPDEVLPATYDEDDFVDKGYGPPPDESIPTFFMPPDQVPVEESTTNSPRAMNCPAPNVSYNGSLLSGEGLSAPHHWVNGVPVFNAVQEVEFEVKVGPFPPPKHTQKCKLTCKNGQWIGPLCRNSNGDYNQWCTTCNINLIKCFADATYHVLLRSCQLNVHPPHMIITYQYQELKVHPVPKFVFGKKKKFGPSLSCLVFG